MYPSNFDYYRAGSLDEAVSLLKQHKGAKVLAGGHSLLPSMKLRVASPGVLVDISRVKGLSGIDAKKGAVTIGSTTTHAVIAASKAVPAALAEAASGIGDQQVRNRGTIGGNVANADPASDLPTVLLALGATFHVTGAKGKRDVSVDDFFKGIFTTALADGDILTSVEVPAEDKGTGSAYAKLAHPASRYALVGAAVSVSMKGGKCAAARVAVGGLTPAPTRLTSVEKALVGSALDEAAVAAAAEAAQAELGSEIIGDQFASADYRRAMVPVYVRHALDMAASRAR
jgi:carbon-monoxide dehydrogenase medium subunit